MLKECCGYYGEAAAVRSSLCRFPIPPAAISVRFGAVLSASPPGPATAVAPDATGLRQSPRLSPQERPYMTKDPFRWQTSHSALPPTPYSALPPPQSHISPRRRFPLVNLQNQPNSMCTVSIGAGYCSDDDVGWHRGDGDDRLSAGTCGSQHVLANPLSGRLAGEACLTRDSPDPVTFRGLHVLTYHRDDFM